MTRRTFKSELESLILALNANNVITGDVDASKILDDFRETILCCRMRKYRRFLIWGLLVGRSVDSFTKFFLRVKYQSITNPREDTFNKRINRICRTNSPLVTDLSIVSDLTDVKNERNRLFHVAGTHFNDSEMRSYVFKSVRSVQQLIRDM